MPSTREGYTDCLTVAELIEALRTMPQDAPVVTEGCDCLGDAAAVRLDFDVVSIDRKVR